MYAAPADAYAAAPADAYAAASAAASAAAPAAAPAAYAAMPAAAYAAMPAAAYVAMPAARSAAAYVAMPAVWLVVDEPDAGSLFAYDGGPLVAVAPTPAAAEAELRAAEAELDAAQSPRHWSLRALKAPLGVNFFTRAGWRGATRAGAPAVWLVLYNSDEGPAANSIFANDGGPLVAVAPTRAAAEAVLAATVAESSAQGAEDWPPPCVLEATLGVNFLKRARAAAGAPAAAAAAAPVRLFSPACMSPPARMTSPACMSPPARQPSPARTPPRTPPRTPSPVPGERPPSARALSPVPEVDHPATP